MHPILGAEKRVSYLPWLRRNFCKPWNHRRHFKAPYYEPYLMLSISQYGPFFRHPGGGVKLWSEIEDPYP